MASTVKGSRLRVLLAVLALGCVVTLTLGQQAVRMSDEERIVRTTYARLSYAVQVSEVHRAISEADADKNTVIDQVALARRLKDVELNFELSDFKVGNVNDAEIGKTRYSALVTKPSGDSLSIATGHWTFGTDSPPNGSAVPLEVRSAVATVQWQKSQTITEDWEQPWATLFPQIENASWFSRYASFKVKVSFQGRSREYRGMFLFGRDPKTGAEYVIPVDTIAGLTGGLHFFIRNSAYPEALIEGGMGREIPAVHDWLTAQAATGKSHEDNCDPATLRCGVSRQDVQKLESLPRNIHLMKTAPPRQAPLRAPRLLDAGFHRPLGHFMQSTPTDCTQFNKSFPHLGDKLDSTKHNTGHHELIDIASSSCTYANGASNTCDTTCNVSVQTGTTMGDIGSTTGFCHATNFSTKDDTKNAVGAGADCGGGAGGGVKECLLCACNVTVSITNNGANVSVTSDGFYTADDGLGQVCAAQAKPSPTPTPTPTPPPDPGGTGGGGCPNVGGDGYNPNDGGAGGDGCSPIIVDLEGKGFPLTSAANGVRFDITGTGHPIQLAWTSPGAQNGFLALDRNGNGIIDDGTELFGNFTPQPSSAHPNGFLALAVYDQPENGGNGDGVIDARDKIFSSLRIWVDANHDGVCQPQELHTLPELGVYSISLKYSLSYWRDEFGNVFRYKSRVNPEGAPRSDEVGKKAYDVFLVAH